MHINFPLGPRETKPRAQGITMVIDKGLGLKATEELLQVAGPYIDFIKLGFGTAALYSKQLLLDKIALIREMGVEVYPGGTFLEVAFLQGKLNEYFEYASNMGFSSIEVSDGTVPIPLFERGKIISQANSLGFTVLAEVGKKDPRDELGSAYLLEQITEDLYHGAQYVIIEGRETGKGIGMYDQQGKIKTQDFQTLKRGIGDLRAIMWEAPQKSQQTELIRQLGPNVNLGNIAATEVLALEALRLGLRGDTLRDTLK